MKKEFFSVLVIIFSKEIYELLENIQDCESTGRGMEDCIPPLDITKIPYSMEAAEKYFEELGTHLMPDLIMLEIMDNFPVWEYIKKIQKKIRHTEILLVTKEKKFDDAYLALQHHVLNLLVMPMDELILLNHLKEAYKKVKIFKEIQLDREKLNLFELRQHQVFMEKMMRNILEKPDDLELLLSEVNNRYETALQNDLFQALVIDVDRPELFFDKAGFGMKVLQLIEIAFPSAHEVVSSVTMPYGIISVINFSASREKNIEDEIEQLYKDIIALQTEYSGFSMVIGVGKIVYSMKEVNFSLQEALRAGQYKLTSPEKKILYAAQISEESIDLEPFITAQQRKRIIRTLKTMNESNIEQMFDQIIEALKNGFKEMPEGYKQLKNIILDITKETWQDVQTQAYFEEEDLSLQQLEHIFDGEKMMLRLKEIILSICKRRKATHINDISPNIQTGIDYIHQHYNEAISFENLANICDLSPNYFSLMFKEQVGETYIDYVTEVRLTEATKLLDSTQKIIQDIAHDVGYLDDKYFRKLFKNRFGMTPSAYRKGKNC